MGIFGNTYKEVCKDYSTNIFLRDLNTCFESANSYIDNIWFTSSILKEDNELSTDIKSVQDYYDEKEREEKLKEEKGKLKNRLKAMLYSFLKWVKSIWDKLLETVRKALDKVRETAVKDKALSLLFDKLSYDDIDKARDNGWKGLSYEKTVMCVPANIIDSEIIRKNRKHSEDNIKNIGNDINDIIQTQDIEKAKELYESVKTKCEDVLNDRNNNVHDWNTIEFSRNLSGGIARAFGKNPDFRGLFVYMRVKNSNYPEFGYPDREQFDNCKLLALKGETYVNDIRKNYYNNYIKGIEEFINADINNILDAKIEDYKYGSDTNQIFGYYNKAMLISDKTQLTLRQRILTEVIQIINLQIKNSLKSYVAMFTSVKAYQKVHNTEDKATATS